MVRAANSASTTDSDGKPKTAIFGFQVGGNTYYDLNDDYTSLIPDIASDVDMQDLYRSLTNSVSTDSDLVNGDTFTIGTDTLEITSITAKSSVAAGEYTLTRVDDDQLKIENEYGKSQIIYLSDLVATDSSTLDFNQFGITIQLQNNSSDTEYSAENIVDSLDGRSITISGIANELYYYGLNASKFISIAPRDPADYFDGGAENISADSANTLQKLSSVFGISVSNLVSDVGIQVSEWTYTQKADTAVLTNLEAQRNEISGVNLDEEAANLLKYQQLYSASTKVLQTGNQMFNSLLMIMS